MSALRRAAWPVKYDCLKLARTEKAENPATGRMCMMHRCADCRGEFPAKQMTVDHICPVVPIEGHDSWDAVIKRLYVELDGLQALCKDCHKIKTDLENLKRKQWKKALSNARRSA
jgi:5-methylcytosine-specific restriction endonuclease McrA